MRRPRRQRGVALLLAVAVVAVLTLTVFPFVYDGRVERAVATNLYTSVQARHLAESGVVVAEVLLRRDATRPGGDAYDGLDETWAQLNNVPVAFGGGAASMVIVDEQGKLPLNSLVSGNAVNPRWQERFTRFLSLLELEPAPLLDPLIDRLDDDDRETGSYGAEERYYLGLTAPYRPAKGILTTVAELGLVKGWTREVVDKVSPFVTVYGNGRVNPNTAPLEVLVGLGLEPSQAEAVIDHRQKDPLRSAAQIREVPGLSGADDNLVQALTPRSDTFRVTVTGSFRDSVAIVHTVLRKGGQYERLYWRVE